MNNIHAHWYMKAVEGLIGAIGKRTSKQSPHQSQARYNFCQRTASDLTERAQCVMNTFQERDDKKGNKRQFHPMKKNRKSLRRRRSVASSGNYSRRPNIHYYGYTVGYPTTPPPTTPYPSPIEALSRLVVHAIRGGDNELPDPSQQSPTISKLRTLHSLVKQKVKQERPSRRVELLSPRLAPLLPRTTAQSRRIYSPSLLSFYRDSAVDNVVSLPDVLDDAGMTSNDQEALLEMVLEVSGARRTIDEIFQAVNNEQSTGMSSQISNATRWIEQVWAQVRKSFSWRQHRDLLDNGFAFLRRDQLERLFGENGLYESASLGIDLDEYEKWTWKDKEDFLKKAVRHLTAEPRSKRRRRAELAHPKRMEGNATSNEEGKEDTKGEKQEGEDDDEEEEEEEEDESSATTLEPFAFSASVLSPSLLGPVTLSPNLFTPAILSPALLGPTTLSPAIGNPTILSPYVLGPTTLSPGILAPGILSPYVLSPNIVNFFVLSPAILSPAVLSPDILSPTLLSPTILSPLVLSPAILSDPLDDSPTILSPSVLSK
uniref:Uncharacterized protein n=1 Tax=Plectus sambesii TaxID=2011161 RepID=A0A914W4E0_9BILA